MTALLHLVVVAALVCLVVFQTNRSIYVRSLGLFLILAAEMVQQFQAREGDPNLGLIVAMSILVVLGFASDYYAASLRTWYFRVHDQAIWGLFIGGFVGLLITGIFPHPLLRTMMLFILGSLIGALIGEARARGMRSAAQIAKAVLGTFAGVFGMAVKLLLGIEMAHWFLIFR